MTSTLNSEKPSRRRRLSGRVLQSKMQKTIVVRVERVVLHPKYKKRFLRSRNYKVHDPSGAYQEGEQVWIEETRPLSKEKHWRVVGKL